MRKYSDLFQKYDLKPNKIKIIGKATIIDTNKGKYPKIVSIITIIFLSI